MVSYIITTKQSNNISEDQSSNSATLSGFINDIESTSIETKSEPIINNQPEIIKIQEESKIPEENVVPSIPIKESSTSPFLYILFIIMLISTAFSINIAWDKYNKYNDIIEYLKVHHKISENDILKQIHNKTTTSTKITTIELDNSITSSNKWVKVIDVQKYFVLSQFEDGSIEKRTSGSLSWRINNPGRITISKFATEMGSIGSYEKYAIFPTLEIGRRANEILLFENSRFGFSNKSLLEAMKKYSTLNESNALKYAEEIINRTSISSDKLLSSLSKMDRIKILTAIEEVEEFKIGKQFKYKNIEELKSKG